MKKLTWWQVHRWDVDVDHMAATTIAVVRKRIVLSGYFLKKTSSVINSGTQKDSDSALDMEDGWSFKAL